MGWNTQEFGKEQTKWEIISFSGPTAALNNIASPEEQFQWVLVLCHIE